MLFTFIPTQVFAARNCLEITPASAKVGDEVTLTYTAQKEINDLAAVSIRVTFDSAKFEVTAVEYPKLSNFSPTGSNVKESNTNSWFSVSWADEDAGLVIPANTALVKATLKVKAGGGSSSDFNVAHVAISDAAGTTLDNATNGLDKTSATVTIPKAPITSVTASVDAPVKGKALDTTVDIGTATGYTSKVEWYRGNTATGTAVTGSAAANQVYTVKITLTAKTGESFDAALDNTTTTEGYAVKKVSNTELLLTMTFPKTNDKGTPVCVAPTGVTAAFGSALSTITLTNPTGNTDGRWYWMDNTQKVGNVKDNPHTYKAKFVPTDTANYKTVENIDVTVTATQVALGAGSPIMIPIEVYYTGSALEPTPKIMTVLYGDELVLGLDYEITKYEDNTNVGTGKIFIAPLANGNYSFTAGSYTFDIKAGTSSISITGDPGKTYDGNAVDNPAVSKSGSTGAVTYTYYTDAACTTKTTTASGAASDGTAPKNAGDYWVQATLAADSNYGSATSIAKKFTISQKALTDSMITLGTQNTYNGTEQSVQIASVMDGTASLIAGGHDYRIVSGDKATNVGNKTLVIEGKGNYTGEARATWSLVAKDVTITPDAKSKTYGDADPELTYNTDISDTTLKGKFNDAVGTTKLGRVAGEDVGMYAIKLGELKAGNNFKLTLATTPVYLTINPAKPVITATTPRQLVKNDVEVDITGWASFNNTDSGAKLTYTLDGTPTGITLTGNMLKAADDASTVSTFNIKVTATATTNFTAPTEKVIVVNVVTKSDAGVSITTPPASKTYGDANFSLAATKSASAPDGGTWSWNSSNPAILEIISGADTATPTIKVKKADTTGATLTVTYTSDTHYGSASAAITVAQKEVTISGITAANKEYDGSTTATPTGTAVINGKVGSDDVTATAGTATFADKNVGTGKTVTFTGYSLSGADAGNYNLKAQPASVTANITAKVVKLTGGINATDRSYVKDNKTVGLTKGTLTFDGLVSGETLDVNIPTTGTISDAKVGAYNVTYSGVTLADGTGNASNYKLVGPLPTVTVNITKASAPALSNIPVSQKYNVTTGEKVISSVMPADAGTLTYTKGTESKTGSVTVTSWAVDTTGKVTYTLSGGVAGDTVTLPVTIGSDNYADATVNVVITIIKATPTGEPAYTKITTSGKTLADAALTTTGSTLYPNAGTLVWVDNAGNVLPGYTEVKANTNYKWRFTPADANYESISGTIKLWSKSSGGSGSYYPAGITFTTDLPVGTINRVAVNGKTLDTKNYVVNGSDVTLLQSYLDTLKAGKYTVKIENKTHVSTGTFTIKADGTLSSPRTADAGVCLYAAMALMSGTGAAYVTLRRKKEN